MNIEFTEGVRKEEMPNIIIFLLDAFRVDYAGCYGNPEGLTPNLDKLAGQGVLIERMTTVAPWTGPSQASLFSGLYPNQHRCNWNTLRMRPGIYTIWDIFHAIGYHSVASLSNDKVDNVMKLLGDHTEVVGWRTPATKVKALDPMVAKEMAFDEEASRAPMIVKYFTDWLDRSKGSKEPFIAYLNVYDCHTRYRPTEPYKSTFISREDQKVLDQLWEMGGPFMLHFKEMNREIEITPEMIRALRSQFKAQVKTVDDALGTLLRKLSVHNILDKTIFIAIADHGDQLGDHKFPSFHHQSSIYNCLLWITSVFHYPKGIPKGKRVGTKNIQIVDVLGTILDLCKIKKPDFLMKSPGTTLVPYFTGQKVDPPRDYGIAMYEVPKMFIKWNKGEVDEKYLRKLLAIWDLKYKLIFSDGGYRELYDIEGDWDEQSDIHKQFPEMCSDFEKKFYDILESYGGIPDDYLVTAVSPESEDVVIERLRALGYLP